MLEKTQTLKLLIQQIQMFSFGLFLIILRPLLTGRTCGTTEILIPLYFSLQDENLPIESMCGSQKSLGNFNYFQFVSRTVFIFIILFSWDNLIICYMPMTVRKMPSSNSKGKQWPVPLNILGIQMHFHH